MQMRKLQSYVKNITLMLLAVSIAVLVGVFCVWNDRQTSNNTGDIDTDLMSIVYEGSDFASDAEIDLQENYVNEMSAVQTSASLSDSFQLTLSNNPSDSSFTFYLDKSGDGLYEEDERNYHAGDSVFIDKSTTYDINFKIIPNKGKDSMGLDANAYYISAIYFYVYDTASAPTSSDAKITDILSARGSLVYPNEPVVVGDLQFNLTHVDNETGVLDCSLAPITNPITKNLKIEFEVTHRDNLSYANYLKIKAGEGLLTSSVSNGAYEIMNSGSTFSVDDELSICISPHTEILKSFTIGKLASDEEEFEEWFKIFGGVAGGDDNFVFSEDVANLSNIISINNYALGFKYTENYHDGNEYGRFSKVSKITNGSGEIVGVQAEVENDLILDHRHKFIVKLYDTGMVEILKYGNECLLQVSADKQYYFIINLQEAYSDGGSSASVHPYKSIKVSTPSSVIVSAGEEELKELGETTFIGVSDDDYLIEMSVEIYKENYSWYSNPTMNINCISADGSKYSETFNGGTRTMTAIGLEKKSVNLTISVHLFDEIADSSSVLKKSSLKILMGLTPETEIECIGAENNGTVMQTFAIEPEESSVTCSYSVKIPFGLEIFKLSINGEESIIEPTLLEIKNQSIILEEDCTIVCYVKVIQLKDVNVVNQYLDEPIEVGKLSFYASPSTVGIFKIIYVVNYKDALAETYQILNSDNAPLKTGYKLVGLFDANAENGEDDNFIDSENGYKYVGLVNSEYINYPSWVNNETSYITYLYILHNENGDLFNFNCIFEPITYSYKINTTPEKTEENLNPETIEVYSEVTYDDTKLYLTQELYSAVGHYVAGICYGDKSTSDYFEILFVDDEIEYDEEKEMYYYELELAWNIAQGDLVFNTLLKPRTYLASIVIAEISKFYNNEYEETFDLVEYIKYNDTFKISEILQIYTGELVNGLPGYELKGYIPFAGISSVAINDGAVVTMFPGLEKPYIYDLVSDMEYVESLLYPDEEYTWTFQRQIRFVPVFVREVYTVTVYPGSDTPSGEETATRTFQVSFNDELTEEFISENFAAPQTRKNGYDYAGYYMMKNANPIKVIGVEKEIIAENLTVKYTSVDITGESGGSIEGFSYRFAGKTYWGIVGDLSIYLQFDKLEYDVKLSGIDAEYEEADLSSQKLAIFEKDLFGNVSQVGSDLTYATFTQEAKTLDISNILAIKGLGDEGSYVSKIRIKYNSIFDPETFRTAYEFSYGVNKNGKMILVNAEEDVAELIYYNPTDNSFYIDINQVITSETSKFYTVATIDDILIELEYSYRTYVVGFQTGLYRHSDLSLIVTPAMADIAYYFVNYKTRNDYTTWIPCDSDGNYIDGNNFYWQQITFKHNFNDVTLEEGSLTREQEIDVMVGTKSFFFCYWARPDKNGNIEPLSWEWTDGSANMANSEDGGSLIYYSAFSSIADINVYYYTWDPVTKEQTGEGYVSTAQKGYFWFKENQDITFKTVNSYETFKIGNHTYFITGWLWIEDNVDFDNKFQSAYYDKKNNMFVDSTTATAVGIDNAVEDYFELLETCSVKYRRNTTTDEDKIKIHCYAVYSLYSFNGNNSPGLDFYNVSMNVPNDYAGNHYEIENLHWGAVSYTKYSQLLGKYLTAKDVLNSGEIEIKAIPELDGRSSVTTADFKSFLDGSYDMLICYYGRDFLNETLLIVDALCVGSVASGESSFTYDRYPKIDSYADGTFVGALDEVVELSGVHQTAYLNAVNQMRRKYSGDLFNQRELLVRITLQLLQWDSQFGTSTTKGIVYGGARTVGFSGELYAESSDLHVPSCISIITSKGGGLISVTSEGFVRLVYAIAGYSVSKTSPHSVYGLFGNDELKSGTTLVAGGSLNSSLGCGDIVKGTSGEYSIWLYSYEDTEGSQYSVMANCGNTTSATSIIGSNKNVKIVDGNLVHTVLLADGQEGSLTYLYNSFITYID